VLPPPVLQVRSLQERPSLPQALNKAARKRPVRVKSFSFISPVESGFESQRFDGADATGLIRLSSIDAGKMAHPFPANPGAEVIRHRSAMHQTHHELHIFENIKKHWLHIYLYLLE
jgi:hypothetical protein